MYKLLIILSLILACVHSPDRIWAPPSRAMDWDSVPLSVYADPSIGNQAVKLALRQWNDVCRLFVRTTDLSSANVRIVRSHEASGQQIPSSDMWDESSYQATFGTAWYSTLGYVRIDVHAVGSAEEYVAIVQGLGRALGLDSDESSRSVMARRVKWKEPLPFLEVALEDREALRERYCTP